MLGANQTSGPGVIYRTATQNVLAGTRFNTAQQQTSSDTQLKA